MQNLFIMSVIFLFNSSCESSIENGPEEVFDITVENLVEDYQFPTQGFYYEYQFDSYKDYIPNVEDVLLEYIGNGIELLDAWYKPGSSSCSPPNSQYAMQVIIEPDFVLRTKSQNNYLVNNNFILVEMPPRFFCGYYVKHYVPRN